MVVEIKLTGYLNHRGISRRRGLPRPSSLGLDVTNVEEREVFTASDASSCRSAHEVMRNRALFWVEQRLGTGARTKWRSNWPAPIDLTDL